MALEETIITDGDAVMAPEGVEVALYRATLSPGAAEHPSYAFEDHNLWFARNGPRVVSCSILGLDQNSSLGTRYIFDNMGSVVPCGSASEPAKWH